MTNSRAIFVKILPATNSRGTRVKLIDYIYNENKTLGYNYRYNSGKEQALEYLKANGFKPTSVANIHGGLLIITEDFKKRLGSL